MRFSLRGVLVLSVLALGCSAAGSGSGPAGNGSGGSGGGAGGGEGGFGGDSGQGGAGGLILDGGGGGAGEDVTLADGPGVVNDGSIDVTSDSCSDAGHTPGPVVRACAQSTDDECNGASDVNAALPNGSYGNGFDDDCDGKVDEGCDCDPAHAGGSTKDCWLVPSSQVDPSTHTPVGWCASNSKGTVKCDTIGTGENPVRKWDPECRGAQPPFPDDVCALGDFDCDGLSQNSKGDDCACSNAVVECPTGPMTLSPYPPLNALPNVDGSTWIKGGNPAQAQNWVWTVTGGDCDNIQPWPSFSIYGAADTTVWGNAILGAVQNNLGPSSNQRGWLVGPQPSVSVIYPAFALSGDYLVKGEFDLAGKHYSCTQKVQVRAPGIRAELCWTPMPNDVDLHFARLQNPDACSSGGDGHGWFQTCRTDEHADDCYYLSASGCTGFAGNPSAWGYAQSPYTACHGWGSRRDNASQCDNPRLDFDNISCDATLPTPAPGLFGFSDFCGAENINLDNPNDGERFAIGAHAYSIGASVKTHVNIYCNGERRLSLGYDPITAQQFPEMSESGAEAGGDFWEVAVVTAKVAGGQMTDCQIDVVHSKTPKPTKDGSSDVCVDTNPKNAATGNERNWSFMASQADPTTADDLCWH